MSLEERLSEISYLCLEFDSSVKENWQLIMNEYYSSNKDTVESLSHTFKKISEEVAQFKNIIDRER